MSNVISLHTGKPLPFDSKAYSTYLVSLGKADLLYEMTIFNDELQKLGYNESTCEKGIILYNEVLLHCTTPELTEVCREQLVRLEKK